VRLIVRSVAFALLLVGVSPVFGPVMMPALPTSDTPTGAYWVEASPQGDDEKELHQAAVGAGSPEERAARFVEIAERDGTMESLARVGAGLALLDLSRTAEALVQLQDDDIDDDTKLGAHALLALARANDRLGDFKAAADAYRDGAARSPMGPRRCAALLRGAEIGTLLDRFEEALGQLREAQAGCEGSESKALLQQVYTYEKKGDPRAAASAADQLYRDFPATPEAEKIAARMKALVSFLPPMSQEERDAREGTRALKLFDAGQHRAATAALRALVARTPPVAQAATYRVRLGRALIANNKDKEGLVHLKAVPADSEAGAEAAYFIARQQARAARRPDAYANVVSRFPGTPWAEEALADQAHFYQKDARDDEALPYFRRIVAEYPQGKYVDAATWRVAWGDRRHGHRAAAAELLEKAIATRPRSGYTAGFLYWAGRLRRELGEEDRAVAHLTEGVRRYKHAYHGVRAQQALGSSLPDAAAPPPGEAIPDSDRERIRQLLLINRLGEALDELRALPPSPQVEATRAVILHQQGDWRAAINAMRRGYPGYLGAGGQLLPDPLWRLMYPIRFEAKLREEAEKAGLDPALVAAVIWQESTFDPQAVSGPGARGLMQVMPPTGRELARGMGIKYHIDMLHDPDRGLELGTRYLRRMIDNYAGRVDRALAAYNAGPGRVSSWMRARPGLAPEEFIESIPFQETRGYVMTILANREHYRRIYGLSTGEPLDVTVTR
jgi:soluble lytic murein transglycosylase